MRVCGLLEKSLSRDIYDRWIAVISPVELAEERLSLSVANDFYQCWLEENYLPLITEHVRAVCGRPLKISFCVRGESAPAVLSPPPAPMPAAVRPRSAPRIPAPPPCSLHPNFTFDAYIVGPSNSLAHATSMAVARLPAKAYNPLLIHGGSGLGKTHLMQAIGHAFLGAQKSARVCYLSAEAFFNEYIDALQNKTVVAFRKRYRDMDMLLIDDIHFLAGKPQLQEEFFHTFNALFDGHKQIVLTCDKPASEVAGIEPRLISRFEWGVSAELEPPDLETRVAILKKKAEQMKLALPDATALFIAERIRSNVRRLESALLRIAAFDSLKSALPSNDMMENLLRDIIEQDPLQPPTVEAIQRAVAEYYDLRLADMRSARRQPAVARPRQVAMYLCRSLTPLSLPVIGGAFEKNHATVLYACRLVEKEISRDSRLRQDVTELRRRFEKACK